MNKIKFLFLLFIFLSKNSFAGWIDTIGNVKSIITYAYTETVLVSLSESGANIDQCTDKSTFAISKNISLEARQRMFSTLLAAQAAGKKVIISYSDSGNCEPWDANKSQFRIITRLRIVE